MAVLALLAAVTSCVARIGLSNKTSNAWTKGGGRRSHPPPGPQPQAIRINRTRTRMVYGRGWCLERCRYL